VNEQPTPRRRRPGTERSFKPAGARLDGIAALLVGRTTHDEPAVYAAASISPAIDEAAQV
jgi:hypothetical protein